MVSKLTLAVLLATLSLTATRAARAQTAPPPAGTPVDPTEVPRDPLFIDQAPPDREMPHDQRVFFDPRVGVMIFGYDRNVVVGGVGGVDIHFRMARFHSVVLSGAAGGGWDVTHLDADERGRYAYDFGLAYCFRLSEDVFRLMGGVAFLELRDQGNLVLGHGVAAQLTLGGGGGGWLGRFSAAIAPGWDAEGDMVTLYQFTFMGAYTF